MKQNRKYDCIEALQTTGITYEDAQALRRISMTLHRWHELECGDSNNYVSVCLVRGRKVGHDFQYEDDFNGEPARPYLEQHWNQGPGRSGPSYTLIPDREKGALKRLAAIMARYPSLDSYVQGDPRGASLYILRPGDVPEGKDTGAYYSRGIAVYK